METVNCGGQSLDEPQIAAVEKAVSDMKVDTTYILFIYNTCVCNVMV